MSRPAPPSRAASPRRRLLVLLLVPGLVAAESATPAGPEAGGRPAEVRLQILNRAPETATVSQLGAGRPPAPAATIPAGGQVILPAEAGTEFVIVGATTGLEERVAARLPVQAFVFRPDPAPPAGVEADPEGRVVPPPAALKVDPFHAKCTTAGGFPIVASARVSDFALLEAAHLVDALLAARPDVRRALVESGTRLCILGHDEYTTDLPEFAFLAEGAPEGFPGLSGRDYWDARARGTGGSATDPYCSCGEENLLGYEGDPYAAECVLIHEFAHAVHLRGMANVDPSFDARLRAAYDAALREGLWKGTYASVNHHEYFAEGVQSWFDDNRVDDHDHNHVHRRSQLVEYDPRLAALCREVFGDAELRYTKPATRLSGHLAGYDPATAPRFAWPARLAEAQARILRHAQDRSRDAGPRPGPPEDDDAHAPR